ncbi:MAG: hypothetical protein H7Y01_13490 [Ferruginibacter sp.]|nr:hypothetical protein [Chitinophagaceae bacterium]
MKKISSWAKDHKWSARIIIVLSFAILNILGVITGGLLTSLGITIPGAIFVFFACTYCAGFIAYPSRSLKKKKLGAAAFYVRQKSCDLLLAGSTFLMIVCLGNRPGQLFRYDMSFNAALASNTSLPKDSTLNTYKTIAAFSASMKDENGKSLKWKERKKLLKEQVKAIKKSTEPSKGGKVALIILSVIVAIGLLGLVLGLACNLSCSGSDAAAILVGVGGTALVVFLLVITIRAIQGKKKKPKDPDIKMDGTALAGKN